MKTTRPLIVTKLFDVKTGRKSLQKSICASTVRGANTELWIVRARVDAKHVVENITLHFVTKIRSLESLE
jgi:hypothetical protein